MVATERQLCCNDHLLLNLDKMVCTVGKQVACAAAALTGLMDSCSGTWQKSKIHELFIYFTSHASGKATCQHYHLSSCEWRRSQGFQSWKWLKDCKSAWKSLILLVADCAASIAERQNKRCRKGRAMLGLALSNGIADQAHERAFSANTALANFV